MSVISNNINLDALSFLVHFSLKVPWNQIWSFLGVSINMLVLRLSVCQCAPKQWQNSHLEDISIQSLQFVTSAKTAQWFFWRHIVLHLPIKLSVQSNALEFEAPAPYTINRRWSHIWNRSLVHRIIIYGWDCGCHTLSNAALRSSTALNSFSPSCDIKERDWLFKKGAGLLDMSRPVFLFQLKWRQHIE